MSGSHPIDGSLPAWEDVADEADWKALLLGNGLSINICKDFDYGSLFEKASRGSGPGELHDRDCALFEEFGTENFELVLGNLNTTIRTDDALGLDVSVQVERYQSIKAALGAAVRAVHMPRDEASDIALEAIKDTMEGYDAIFSTSYDLLVYWSMPYPENEWGRLVDLFWANGRNEFDPDYATPWTGRAPVYFMHGALHLIVEGDGTTRKLTWTEETLLEQFGQPIPDEPQARPLLVTEGSWREKLRAINDNDYLSHALDRLRECEMPLVVFGSALGEQDVHLAQAINENPGRPVAVSMRRGKSKSDRLAKQGEIRSRLSAVRELHFYDATTHLLGSSEIADSRLRRLKEAFGLPF